MAIVASRGSCSRRLFLVDAFFDTDLVYSVKEPVWANQPVYLSVQLTEDLGEDRSCRAALRDGHGDKSCTWPETQQVRTLTWKRTERTEGVFTDRGMAGHWEHWPPVSPGPACVHLDDLSVSRFGPEKPGVPSVLQGALAVRTAVTVENVITMETVQAANLVQLEVLRFIGEVEGSQSRLLQDNTGTAGLGTSL